MKLFSSTFIGIILAFLMFMGYKGQPVNIVENPTVPDFSYMTRGEGPMLNEKIRIEIFDDLTCADCTEFMKNTIPKIKDMKQKTDKIDLHLYFVPDVNNEIFHEAAMSLKCAADQDQFWEMHKKLHEYKNDLGKKSFAEIGKELELNVDAIQDCMKEKVHQKSIEEDIQYTLEKNITFKPVILINEYKLIGNQPFENIQRIINGFLKEDEIIIESQTSDQPIDPEKEMEF